jgi:hypothetical protein
MDREKVTVKGHEIVKVIKEIVKEGNVRRIVVKHGNKVFLDVPVNLAVIGAVLAPPIAAAAFVLALFKECSIEIERETSKKKKTEKVETEPKKVHSKRPKK